MAAPNLRKGIGKRTDKGTLVTVDQFIASRRDYSTNVVIRENNLRIIQEAMRTSIARALEEIGLVAEGYAKRMCPVDTGRLRNSITHALLGSTLEEGVVIGTNVEYAPYVENGTHNRTGKKFLYQAATKHADRYRSILKKHLENA